MSNNVNVNGFHHIAMKVADLDASLKFYTQVLGFEIKHAWGEGDKRGVMINTGNGNYIELFAGGPKGERTEGHWAHLALVCNDTTAAIEKARQAGCPVTMETTEFDIPCNPPLPVRIAFFKGPDGELIEFFQTT